MVCRFPGADRQEGGFVLGEPLAQFRSEGSVGCANSELLPVNRWFDAVMCEITQQLVQVHEAATSRKPSWPDTWQESVIQRKTPSVEPEGLLPRDSTSPLGFNPERMLNCPRLPSEQIGQPGFQAQRSSACLPAERALYLVLGLVQLNTSQWAPVLS